MELFNIIPKKRSYNQPTGLIDDGVRWKWNHNKGAKNNALIPHKGTATPDTNSKGTNTKKKPVRLPRVAPS